MPATAVKRGRGGSSIYLVLDDWTKGYSIHKIQADSFDSDSDSGSDDQHSGAARHLPEPPTLRLECPVGTVPHPGMSFSALGTKIFTFMNQRCSLIYDTKTAAMTIGAHAPADMVCGFGITMVVDEMLHALSYHFRVKQHSFGFMSWGSTAPDALQQPTEGWSWKTLPPPPPTFHRRVNSYALHPDGCTIFMSTANFMTAPSKGCMGTTHSTPRILCGDGMGSGPCHSAAKHTLTGSSTPGLAFIGMATSLLPSCLPQLPQHDSNVAAGLPDNQGEVVLQGPEATHGSLSQLCGHEQVLPRPTRGTGGTGGGTGSGRLCRLCAPYHLIWPQVQSQGRAADHRSPLHALLHSV
ncbi:hypothetical protein VPH35_122788 [Triticum aestivum]|uniref:uncharacterized protein n=1 Tax=Triticum aestivum TaxID=4565 RepID=UPI001D033ABD|nr:uncharacterized protein LOC123151242 [Triticum aestivum]